MHLWYTYLAPRGIRHRNLWALVAVGVCLALVAAFFVVGQTFAAPPSPSVTLSPNAGQAGASVTVNGANFNCKSVDLAFDGASMGTASPTKKVFSASITVPISATVGQHTVTANCAGQKGSAQATFTVASPNPSADLAMSIDGTTNVAFGTPFHYTLTVHNLGPGTAPYAFVSVQLGGLTGTVNQISAGSYDPVARLWIIGPVAANSQETLDLSISAPPTGGLFTSNAVIFSDTADPNVANNTASITTLITPR